MERSVQGAGRSTDGRPDPSTNGTGKLPGSGVGAEGVLPVPGGRPASANGHPDATPPNAGEIGGTSSGIEPVQLIAAPTGAGKTTATAAYVARVGSTVWLTERHEDAAKAVDAIEANGGHVARVLPLEGSMEGCPNCLHPQIIRKWQDKGYNYRQGFCPIEQRCERQADPEQCPFLKSLDALEEAHTVVCTKALARKPKFFSAMGNPKRKTVVIDEDPIGMLRPSIEISRADLAAYIPLVETLLRIFEEQEDEFSTAEAKRSEQAARWCWRVICRQPAAGQPEAVAVPKNFRPSKAALEQTKREQRAGRRRIIRVLHKLMRKDPDGMVRNVYRDLDYMVCYAAGGRVFATAGKVLFHLKISVPRHKRLLILDATANPELLKPILAPRPIQVVCDDQVQPAGRIIQFMDFNGPRSYLNKIPPPAKLVKIIDAIGEHHPEGKIVLISHKSCVERLRQASSHKDRITAAWFGALRGRNDLEPSKNNPIACHVVIGSPKTTEEDRQQLALAVFGKKILPIPDLETVRRSITGRIPAELAQGDEREHIWEVRIKGYSDP